MRASSRGVLLDGGVDDVEELADALLLHRRGRLEELRGAADDVEQRIRERVAESRRRIAEALEKADGLIRDRVQHTTERSREILESRYREGFERGRREGFEAGYSEGFEAGHKEGREQGCSEGRDAGRAQFEEESSGARDAILAIARDLEQRWQESLQAAHRDMVSLVRRVAEQVLLHEVREFPESVERKLHEGIDRVAAGSRLKIEIHPDDLEVARRFVAGLESEVAANVALDIVADDAIARGGCRISNDVTTVDLSHETQLDILERRLLEAGGAS